MNIIVFGGGGFIGSAIVDKLLAAGHAVRVFERPRVSQYRIFGDNEKIEWITGDFSNTHDIENSLEDINVVLHLISTTLPKSSNEDPVYDVQSNVIATINLLQLMVKKNIKKMVFISSGGTIYGVPKLSPISENHPTDPIVSYGVTKLMIEKYMNIFDIVHGVRCISLRVSNPYGERQRVETAQGAIGIFLHNALSGLPINIWGDGTITRDYIHVSDVAGAFVKAIDYSGERRVFNIGSGVGTSLNELVSKIECTINKSIVTNFLPGRPIDVPSSVLCNDLALSELNWKPEVELSSGLIRSAQWVSMQLLNRSTDP